MKANPDELRSAAEDMDLFITRHADALKHQPDLALDTRNLRDKFRDRYEQIAEKKPE